MINPILLLEQSTTGGGVSDASSPLSVVLDVSDAGKEAFLPGSLNDEGQKVLKTAVEAIMSDVLENGRLDFIHRSHRLPEGSTEISLASEEYQSLTPLTKQLQDWSQISTKLTALAGKVKARWDEMTEAVGLEQTEDAGVGRAKYSYKSKWRSAGGRKKGKGSAAARAPYGRSESTAQSSLANEAVFLSSYTMLLGEKMQQEAKQYLTNIQATLKRTQAVAVAVAEKAEIKTEKITQPSSIVWRFLTAAWNVLDPSIEEDEEEHFSQDDDGGQAARLAWEECQDSYYGPGNCRENPNGLRGFALDDCRQALTMLRSGQALQRSMLGYAGQVSAANVSQEADPDLVARIFVKGIAEFVGDRGAGGTGLLHRLDLTLEEATDIDTFHSTAADLYLKAKSQAADFEFPASIAIVDDPSACIDDEDRLRYMSSEDEQNDSPPAEVIASPDNPSFLDSTEEDGQHTWEEVKRRIRAHFTERSSPETDQAYQARNRVDGFKIGGGRRIRGLPGPPPWSGRGSRNHPYTSEVDPEWREEADMRKVIRNLELYERQAGGERTVQAGALGRGTTNAALTHSKQDRGIINDPLKSAKKRSWFRNSRKAIVFNHQSHPAMPVEPQKKKSYRSITEDQGSDDLEPENDLPEDDTTSFPPRATVDARVGDILECAYDEIYSEPEIFPIWANVYHESLRYHLSEVFSPRSPDDGVLDSTRAVPVYYRRPNPRFAGGFGASDDSAVGYQDDVPDAPSAGIRGERRHSMSALSDPDAFSTAVLWAHEMAAIKAAGLGGDPADLAKLVSSSRKWRRVSSDEMC